MPDLKRVAVVEWLKNLRPEAVSLEWPPAVRPNEAEGSVAQGGGVPATAARHRDRRRPALGSVPMPG